MGDYAGYLLLAKSLNKQLHEVMGWPGPMTHRQYIVWSEWLDQQWNQPNRTDYYLMQIAARLTEGKVTLNDFKIKFNALEEVKRDDPKPAENGAWVPKRLSKEDIAKAHQQMKIAMASFKPPAAPIVGRKPSQAEIKLQGIMKEGVATNGN